MAENCLEQQKSTVDKELRLRNLREKQNEERQKKLEEIRSQALAAQRFKEQKEEERRRRLEDMRIKEDVRRQQVEERKKAINEAERDRLESILRKNQQREVKMECKRRNERSNIVFAFGSSTPRNLDPHDVSTTFWGYRRATSTQNIPTCSSSSLTRRQSERDLDAGSKKRATSAGGLERSGDSSTPTTPAGCISGYMGRRRTDLMPTIPSKEPRDNFGSRKSVGHSPGRAYSMSRLDQLAKPRKRPDLPSLAENNPFRPLSLSVRNFSVTRSTSHLAGGAARRLPAKSDDRSRSMHQLSIAANHTPPPPLVPRTTRATQLRQQKLQASSCNSSDASSRPSSSLSQQSTTSVTSSVSVRHRPSSGQRKPRPASIAVTGITNSGRQSSFDSTKSDNKPPIPKTRRTPIKTTEKSARSSKASSGDVTPKLISSPTTHTESVADTKAKVNGVAQQKKPPDVPPATETTPIKDVKLEPETQPTRDVSTELIEETPKAETAVSSSEVPPMETSTVEPAKIDEIVEETEPTESQNLDLAANQTENEMTASFTKVRISTEEEAKAALAERRRLIREEAERKAEQERLQKEMEAKAELERQQREEEQLRQLIEAQRAAEQERLDQAIKEAQKKEEEEKQRREEEQRLRALKEEADKKAREEAERQKAEQAERLKNEEKEREARRKRVEAIMLRTRGKHANSNSQQNPDDSNENKSENTVNGTKQPDKENGTKNGKDIEIVDNIISDDTLKNANTITNNSADSINSNNSWQGSQQFGNLVFSNNN